MWPPDDYTANPAYPSERPPEHPEEALAAFALNALDDAEFQAVFHHVVRCLHCQEVLLGFRETAARLTASAPAGAKLPENLKARVLSAAVGRPAPPAPSTATPAPPPNAASTTTAGPNALPPPDPRWSPHRLRRWLTPAIISALCLMLAASLTFIALQQREISRLTLTAAGAPETGSIAAAPQTSAAAIAAAPDRTAASTENPAAATSASAPAPPASASASAPGLTTTAPTVAPQSQPAAAPPIAPAPTTSPPDDTPIAASDSASASLLSRVSSALNPSLDRNNQTTAGATDTEALAVADSEKVNLVKQEMADVVEATVLSAQPETEKLAMTSPLGTEPEAKGVLIVDPTGLRAVLMVSGMPADSYQIWLVRGNKQMLVDRIIINDDAGAGVKHLQLHDSVFDFQEVALLPDERHGPTTPTGAKFLSARIINGPPLPPRLGR